jgi:hypothetical protein
LAGVLSDKKTGIEAAAVHFLQVDLEVACQRVNGVGREVEWNVDMRIQWHADGMNDFGVGAAACGQCKGDDRNKAQ